MEWVDHSAQAQEDMRFIQNRVTELRMKKDISESQMSFDLDKSRGYIHGIVSGKAHPTVEGLLEIIRYFHITPTEFFDVELKEPVLLEELKNKAKGLSEEELRLLIAIADKFQQNK